MKASALFFSSLIAAAAMSTVPAWADSAYTSTTSNLVQTNASLRLDGGTTTLSGANIDLSSFTGTLELSGNNGGSISTISTNGGYGGRVSFKANTYQSNLTKILINDGIEADLTNVASQSALTIEADNASFFFGSAGSIFSANLSVGEGGVRLNGGSGATQTFAGAISGSGTVLNFLGETSKTGKGGTVIITGDTSQFSGTWASLDSSAKIWQFGNGSAATNGSVGGNFGTSSQSIKLKFNFSGDYSVAGDVYASTLTIAGGNATFTGAVSGTGAITVASGATLNLSGAKVALTSAITNSGTVNVDDKVVFVLSGLTGSTSGSTTTYSLVNGGTLNGWDSLGISNVDFSGSSTAARGVTASFSTSNTTGSVSVTAGTAGDLTWNSEKTTGDWNYSTDNTPWTLDGSATSFMNKDNVTFSSGATVTVASSGVTAGTMTVSAGTLTLSGQQYLTADSINIESGATLDLGSFDNDVNVVHKLTGTGTVSFSKTGSNHGQTINLGTDFAGTVNYSGNLNPKNATFGSEKATVNFTDVWFWSDGEIGTIAQTLKFFGTGNKIDKGTLNLTGDISFDSGASFTVGGGTVNISGAVTDGCFTQSDGTLNISGTGTNSISTLNISGGTTNISAGTTVSVGTLSGTGALSGAGRVQFGSLSGFALTGTTKFSNWTGSVVLKSISTGTDFNPNTYGVAGSKVVLDGVGGGKFYFAKSSSNALTVVPDIEIASGGLTLNDGYSSTVYTFSGAISGSGTWKFSHGSARQQYVFTGDVSGFSGTLNLANNSLVTFGNGGEGVTGDGKSVSGTGTITMADLRAVLTYNYSNDVSASTTLAGGMSVVKQGAGSLTLSGNNTFTGGTTVSEGTLVAAHLYALGYTGGPVSVAENAKLQLGASSVVVYGLSGAGSVELASGTDSSTLYMEQLSDTEFSGTIKGEIALNKYGTGTLTLSGENAFTKGSQIDAGTLVAAHKYALGSGTVAVTTDGTLALGAAVVAVGGLSGAGSIKLASGTDSSLLAVASDADMEFAGTIGSGISLYKIDEKTLKLSGANTSLNGRVLVAAGTLEVANASALGTGTLNVASGASVKATTNGVTLNDVYLIADNSEQLTTGDSGKFTVADSATLYIDISALNATATADAETKVDKILLQIASANIISGDKFFGTIAVGTTDDAGNWVASDQWKYQSGSWNASAGTLNLITIPEPSTFGLLAGVGALALVAARRRRRAK